MNQIPYGYIRDGAWDDDPEEGLEAVAWLIIYEK